MSTKNDFIWSSPQKRAFEKVKEEIQKTIILRYFDPKEAIVLQVDASTAGIGVALLQKEMPVTFASKTLTGPDTRYTNIEREIAIIFGLERFHHYILSHRCDPNGS